MAGNALGGPTGGAVGAMAGKLISTITGYGDYKVNHNSVIQGNSVPTFRNGGHGMRVCHREFLANITGSVEFSKREFSINPGLFGTFPWLSYLANQFEEYELDGLVFEYRPSSGSAISSTSSALGVVILATDYDAANPGFTTKQQMESYEFSTSTVPFNGCMHPVECKRGLNVLNNLYLRNMTNPSGTDIRMYDMGNFTIATEGMQSEYVVGELWVSYDVKFSKPRIPSSSQSTLLNVLHLQSSPSNTANAGVPFGDEGPVQELDSSMPTTEWAFTSPTKLTFNSVGTYAIFLYHSFQGVSATPPNYTVGSNIQKSALLLQNSLNQISASNTVFGGFLFGSFNVTATGTGGANQITLALSMPVGAPNGNLDLYVVRVSNSQLTDSDEPILSNGQRPHVDVAFLRKLLKEMLVEEGKTCIATSFIN